MQDQRALKGRRKPTLAIVVIALLALSLGFPVLGGSASVAHPVPLSGLGHAGALTAPVTIQPKRSVTPSPSPGKLVVYDDYGGAEMTTEDPAVAYDTISVEPILNVYETLVAYNGSGSNGLGPHAFVPVLATCVPGTVQCHEDYGSYLLANNTSGVPTYWTFVIDPAARFYDPSTGHSWGVYPTDVMFSMAREMAWSESYGVGTTAGWLIAQALLPNGSVTWDGGLHAPYNTTPANILGSMLVNDSSYCPTLAMSEAHGCITFVVNGGGGPWPQFLQLIGDEYMAVVPCAYFSANGANVTGWDAPFNGTSADSSCLLPDGQTTTDNSAWTTYLNGLSPTSWDAYEEELPSLYPAPHPAVQFHMVGSGPYYGTMDPNGSPPGYSLSANPAYNQPSGCNAT